MPGIGCGQFAGPFRGELGPSIRAIHFDPYSQCDDSRELIHNILFEVRPSKAAGNQPIPQLCPPQTYATAEDDFSACSLYSIVAWDHVARPSNDFYINSRCTDDGVKVAATDAMAVITGVAGNYDPRRNDYRPPEPFPNWNAVVQDRIQTDGLRLWDSAAVVVV